MIGSRWRFGLLVCAKGSSDPTLTRDIGYGARSGESGVARHNRDGWSPLSGLNRRPLAYKVAAQPRTVIPVDFVRDTPDELPGIAA